LPGVALPILAWLGVGNLVSVLLPVATVPMLQRWRQRRRIRANFRWLSHLALPYVLLYAVDPVGDIPPALVQILPRHWRNPETRGLVNLLFGLAIWVIGTVLADRIVRWRGLRLR
jgi:hypothetical protein